jgi:hypothetical protein
MKKISPTAKVEVRAWECGGMTVAVVTSASVFPASDSTTSGDESLGRSSFRRKKILYLQMHIWHIMRGRPLT